MDERPEVQKTWHIEVGDSADLTVGEIWPDGDAPENPTDEDVIAVLVKQGKYRIQQDWGFDLDVEVNHKPVKF